MYLHCRVVPLRATAALTMSARESIPGPCLSRQHSERALGLLTVRQMVGGARRLRQPIAAHAAQYGFNRCWQINLIANRDKQRVGVWPCADHHPNCLALVQQRRAIAFIGARRLISADQARFGAANADRKS